MIRARTVVARLSSCVRCGSLLALLALLVPPAAAEEGPGGFRGKLRPRPHVAVMRPYRADIQRMTRVVAHVEAFREALVYGMVTGRVAPDPVEEGTRVTDGDPLCTIDAPDVAAAHETAKSRVLEVQARGAELAAAVAEAEQAKAQAVALQKQAGGRVKLAQADAQKAQAELTMRETIHKRLQDVLAGSPNLVARDKVDEAAGKLAIARAARAAADVAVEGAQADVDVANAKVNAAEAHIGAAKARQAAAAAEVQVATNQAAEAKVRADWRTVTSPLTGVVTKRMVDTGALVKDGGRNSGAKPLFHIVDDRKLRVWFALATPDAPHCRPGNEVTLVFEELVDPATGRRPYRVATQVTRITDALDMATRTMKVEVVIDNPANEKGHRRLRAGMFCRVEVMLERYPQALVLPTRAVATRKHKSSVLVVKADEDNIVRKLPVEIGVDDGKRIQILGGVTENDLVIVKGAGLVADGEKAAPKTVSDTKDAR